METNDDDYKQLFNQLLYFNNHSTMTIKLAVDTMSVKLATIGIQWRCPFIDSAESLE